MIVVGIDPGTHTGLAVWDSTARRLVTVISLMTHQAQRMVEELQPGLVIYEDANQRRAFQRMDLLQKKYGAAVREGAGAAKRDSTIWRDFLVEKGIPFRAQSPASGLTKWPAKKFKVFTKWAGRTNEHARDAALIVYGLNDGIIQGLINGGSNRGAK